MEVLPGVVGGQSKAEIKANAVAARQEAAAVEVQCVLSDRFDRRFRGVIVGNVFVLRERRLPMRLCAPHCDRQRRKFITSQKETTPRKKIRERIRSRQIQGLADLQAAGINVRVGRQNGAGLDSVLSRNRTNGVPVLDDVNARAATRARWRANSRPP